MKILAITPISPGDILQPLVIYPRLVSELSPIHICREVNININRSRLQTRFITSLYNAYEWVLLIDSDVSVSEDTLRKLEEYAEIGKTACVKTKSGLTDHVITSCALIHKSDYQRVNYLDNPFVCQCHKLPNPFYVEGLSAEEIK